MGQVPKYPEDVDVEGGIVTPVRRLIENTQPYFSSVVKPGAEACLVPIAARYVEQENSQY